MKNHILRSIIVIAIILLTLSGCIKTQIPAPVTELSDSELLDNGDDERATKEQQRDPKEQPDKKSKTKKSNDAVIPEYTIEQTLYQEILAYDGVLLARNEYMQPVFAGDSNSVRKMNDVFVKEIRDVNLDDFEWVIEDYESREGYVYEEAQHGRVGGYTKTCKESWRIDQYISFEAIGVWDGLGTHGGHDVSGYTFDAETGELLSIADILRIAPEDIKEVLYNEYVIYQAEQGYGLDSLALGYDEDGNYNDSYIESVKDQCGVSALFSLAADGVHIYFEEYTFFYAVGASELVIPYYRDDLLRAPFAE